MGNVLCLFHFVIPGYQGHFLGTSLNVPAQVQYRLVLGPSCHHPCFSAAQLLCSISKAPCNPSAAHAKSHCCGSPSASQTRSNDSTSQIQPPNYSLLALALKHPAHATHSFCASLWVSHTIAGGIVHLPPWIQVGLSLPYTFLICKNRGKQDLFLAI